MPKRMIYGEDKHKPSFGGTLQWKFLPTMRVTLATWKLEAEKMKPLRAQVICVNRAVVESSHLGL